MGAGDAISIAIGPGTNGTDDIRKNFAALAGEELHSAVTAATNADVRDTHVLHELRCDPMRTPIEQLHALAHFESLARRVAAAPDAQDAHLGGRISAFGGPD